VSFTSAGGRRLAAGGTASDLELDPDLALDPELDPDLDLDLDPLGGAAGTSLTVSIGVLSGLSP